MFKSLFAALAAAILLILGFVFSVVVLAVIVVLGLAAWGYVWWRTRKLGRIMREQAPGGQVIDGEASVVEEYPVSTRNVLPGDPPGR